MPSGSPPPDPAACRHGAERLVDHCAHVRDGERVAVIAEQDTRAVAEYLADVIRQRTEHLRLEVVPPLPIHGAPPPAHVGETFAWADVLFGLTRSSMAHTAERKRATDRGTRYLSLPDYSLEQLAAPSLAFDFASAVPVARQLKQTLDRGRRVRVTTEAGTEVQFASRDGRRMPLPASAGAGLARLAAGRRDAHRPGRGVRRGCRGGGREYPVPRDRLACEPGPVDNPGRRHCGGRGTGGGDTQRRARPGRAPEGRFLAEFGVGLNPEAQLTGRMLDDEGCAGTIHFGFGSNATIGGRTSVPFHLDFVVKPVGLGGRRTGDGPRRAVRRVGVTPGTRGELWPGRRNT